MKDLILKAITVTVLLLIAAGAGYMAGKSQTPAPQTTTITKTEIQYVDKIVEKKIYVKDTTKTYTTITKPDGTVEHTVVQNNIDSTEQSHENTQITTKIDEKTVIKSTQTNYSLGVRGVLPKPYELAKIPQLQVVVGRRLLGDLWLDAGFNKDSKEVSLGFNYQL